MGERKLKVVLDTNVLISALGWSGPPSDCLNLIIEEDIINFISEPILEELMDVMNYPKFKFTEKEKEEFLEIVISYSILVDPEVKVEKIKEDPDDNKFLECSIKVNADYIISGDQHLLGLKKFRELRLYLQKNFLSYGNKILDSKLA